EAPRAKCSGLILLIVILQSLSDVGLACHLPQELAQQFDELVAMLLQARQWRLRRCGVEQVGLHERACPQRDWLHRCLRVTRPWSTKIRRRRVRAATRAGNSAT